MSNQFRSSPVGFNKKDVVSYLQDLDEKHRSEILSLKTELQHMKADYQSALSKINEQVTVISELQDRLNAATTAQEAEVSFREEELSAYRRAEAAERLSSEKAEAILQTAKVEAEQILSRAQEEALALSAGAQVEADQLLKDARAQSEAVKTASQAITQRLSETMSAIGELLNGTK